MTKKKDIGILKATQYINGVMDGSIVVGKLVRKAVERHLNDLETAKDKGFYFDAKQANKWIKLASVCNHWKGEKAGQAFELEPWQCFYLYVLFGCISFIMNSPVNIIYIV